MLYRVIEASELPKLLEAFMTSYELIAPVKRGRGYVFDIIRNLGDIELNYPTTLSSPKKYIFPHEEVLFDFDAQHNSIVTREEEVPKRVLFGLHACDINAINRLDTALLEGKYCEPYYQVRRNNTLIVGISCTPHEHCFCHLWGADEARKGYDLFLQDIGDRYLVSIASVEAANLLKAHCSPRVATDEDRIAFRQLTRKRQALFNKEIPDIQEVAMLMDAFHKDPFWEELGSRCLSCSACAAVCPTCFCFDIKDELDATGCKGCRKRKWDACTSPEFALVAGGHNFRETAARRVRHRFYHKLNGFLAKHDHMLCVGCGRCVKACKTNINPIEVLRFFEQKGLDEACVSKEG